ncbi:hypothetical protein MRX96_058395 [Rhipicephalus microplus]
MEEQAGPSSTYPLPHMNLWKMEYMKMDAWPAASQAFVGPSESATTSAVPTMASPAPAFVPAAVDSFQSSLKPQFPQLDQNEQQQMTWPESLQKSQESQQSWGEFMASEAGNGLWEMTTSVDIGCPAQPFDDKYKLSFVGESQGEHSHGATTYSASLAQPFDDKYNFNLAGEYSHGATTYGASGKLPPRPVLFSPTHFPQIASPRSYTDSPLSDAKPPLLSPKPQKPEEPPTRRDNGEDTNDFDDGLPLPLEELDSCSAHAPTEPDPSAPTDQGDIYASAHWNGVPRVQTPKRH